MGLYVDIKKKLPGFKLQVELSAEQGIIGILGASGSGKSMLLNCIAGLIRPDEGEIILNGKTFFDSAKKINLPPQQRKVGFLFQNYALFPHMTVAENIAFALGDLTRTDAEKRVAVLIDRLHLHNMEKRYPSQISGGQQQRVALARAMAVEPEILLLDEPFSALDDYLRTQMMKEMLASLKGFEGSTLFVTHNIEEAYRLCDDIAIINTGRVDSFGSKRDLFENPLSFEAAKITGCKNLAAAVRKAENTLEIPDWGITVKTKKPIDKEEGFAGIRANHIRLADDGQTENCFPAWITDESEGPFRTILYLKIGSEPSRPDDYHLLWETPKTQRAELSDITKPIRIYLDPDRVFFVKN
jgi:ABC-type sulfate/molybdate transport systems ATPase subunit